MPSTAWVFSEGHRGFAISIPDGGTSARRLRALIEASASGGDMRFIAASWGVFRATAEGTKDGDDELADLYLITPTAGEVNVWVERVVGPAAVPVAGGGAAPAGGTELLEAIREGFAKGFADIREGFVKGFADLAVLLRPAKGMAGPPRLGSPASTSGSGRASPSPRALASPGGTSPLGVGSPVPTTALETAVASLTAEQLSQLQADSGVLKAAVSSDRPLEGHAMQRVVALGLHRLQTGPLRSSIAAKGQHYDYFVDSDDVVHQRSPAPSTGAAAGGGGAPAGSCSLTGASTFIVASDCIAVQEAAHRFMVASVRAKDKVPCSRLHMPLPAEFGLSLWLDGVTACASIAIPDGGSSSIPLIFHATLAPAVETMPESNFLAAVHELTTQRTLPCLIKAAAEPVEELHLPPPVLTDALLATPAAKPLARQASLSDPSSSSSSGPKSCDSASPPGPLLPSPVLPSRLFVH